MKITGTITFSGTFGELHAWVKQTFKDPSQLGMEVTIMMGTPTDVRETQMRDFISNFKPDFPFDDRVRGGLRIAEGHAKAGNKIEAIKQVRESTSLGLKDAKDFVERFFS